MVDINQIELGILIEGNGMPCFLNNILNEISFSDSKLKKEEVFKTAADILSSLYAEGNIEFKKFEYNILDEECDEFVAEHAITDNEINVLLNNPEKWEEMKVFLSTMQYVVFSTEKGIDYLNTL